MKKCMIRDYIPEMRTYSVRKGTCLPDSSRWQHCHEFVEIVYVSSGKGVHYVDDKMFEVGCGSLLFIDTDVPHSFFAEETMTYFNFYISPAGIDKSLAGASSIWEILAFLFPEGEIAKEKKQPFLQLDNSFLPEIQLCAEKIHREIRSRRIGYEFAVDGYMRLIYAAILRTVLRTSAKRQKIISSDILDYVEKNFAGRITLADLADRFYYSPVYLGQLFKNSFGVSFKKYVKDKRIETAERLLIETDMTVESVTAAVGFSDKKSFYRSFEDKYNCTPLQYRQKHLDM